MHVRLGTMDGYIIESTDWSDADILALISEKDGYIGSEDYSGVRVEDVEDVVAFTQGILDMAMSDRDTGKVTIERHGETFVYDVGDIAWVRIVRD